MTAPPTECGARRPGYDQGPAWGRRCLPCVLAPGHDGKHRSTYGDTWAENDVPNSPTNDAAREAGRVRDVECSAPRCVLVEGHTGAHAEHTEPFVVNGCVSQLAGLLATPGLPRDAGETLHKAATVWETLDTLLSTGGPLPSRWASPRVDGMLAGIDTTPLHGALSEALDTSPPGGGYRVTPLVTLRAAIHTWEALDTVIRAGAALPASWEGAQR